MAQDLDEWRISSSSKFPYTASANDKSINDCDFHVAKVTLDDKYSLIYLSLVIQQHIPPPPIPKSIYTPNNQYHPLTSSDALERRQCNAPLTTKSSIHFSQTFQEKKKSVQCKAKIRFALPTPSNLPRQLHHPLILPSSQFTNIAFHLSIARSDEFL